MIHVATVVRDEASRYLPSALEAWSSFADRIIAFDDHSTDGTLELLKESEKVDLWSVPTATTLWGDELRYRRTLFEYALATSNIGDVVFWLDADMAPLADPTPFLEREEFDGFSFFLYDLWHEEAGRLFYRYDHLWRAHEGSRVWAIRIREDDVRQHDWPSRKIHCGHIPPTWWTRNKAICYIPHSHSILHYGYLDASDRQEKYEKYLGVKHLLTQEELIHAQSIVDPTPHLEALPFEPQIRLQKNLTRPVSDR